jgi:hypothetical protein
MTPLHGLHVIRVFCASAWDAERILAIIPKEIRFDLFAAPDWKRNGKPRRFRWNSGIVSDRDTCSLLREFDDIAKLDALKTARRQCAARYEGSVKIV